MLDGAGFGDATFEELVHIGVFDVCSLPKVSIELIESFVLVLEKLVDGSDEVATEVTETMFTSPPELEPVQTQGFEDLPYVPLSNKESGARVAKEKVLAGPMLNSIEAEKKLLAAFSKIKQHPRGQEFHHHTLDQYWNNEWIRAPFVEALTFKQLAEMKLSNLLDKRTISQHKIQGILKCVDAVCLAYGSDDFDSQLEGFSTGPAEAAGGVSNPTWRKNESKIPVLVASTVALFEKHYQSVQFPATMKQAFVEALSDAEGGLLLLVHRRKSGLTRYTTFHKQKHLPLV